MKFIFLINLSIIIICYSHNLNKLEFIEKKLYLKNNNLLYSLIPKYQAECIKILPAPKPIFKNRGNYSLESNFLLFNLTIVSYLISNFFLNHI